MSEAKGEQSASSGSPSFIFLTSSSISATCLSFHIISESRLFSASPLGLEVSWYFSHIC